MQTALKKLSRSTDCPPRAAHVASDDPRRAEVETFIRRVFAHHYGAQVSAFAPNLLVLEHRGQLLAATGWRSAATDTLFLERYLDVPIERAMAELAHERVERPRIAEVGNLAAEKPGGSLHVIHALATHLERLAFEWVVFTATQQLIGIFTRLGLPLLALAKADPGRLGDEAAAWGSYYASEPIVVAGRIRSAIERLGRAA